MEINGEYETDYWRHVILDWESDNGRVGNRTIHTHKAELKELSDDILGKLQTLKNNPTGFHDDPDFTQSDLQGYPDETMLPRNYTHKLVSLFALSCGIMEKQLGILLTVDLIPSSRRDTYVNEKLDSIPLGRKLEFARDADVIGNGIFSEAWDVRKARNKLVHNPVYRFSIDNYNIHKNRIKKATRAPNKIDSRIQDEI
jgi:hypothetical protein